MAEATDMAAMVAKGDAMASYRPYALTASSHLRARKPMTKQWKRADLCARQ